VTHHSFSRRACRSSEEQGRQRTRVAVLPKTSTSPSTFSPLARQTRTPVGRDCTREILWPASSVLAQTCGVSVEWWVMHRPESYLLIGQQRLGQQVLQLGAHYCPQPEALAPRESLPQGIGKQGLECLRENLPYSL
jgi:hypothetical protein